LKRALLSFETTELKSARAPLEAFEKKYGDGDQFMKKFNSDLEAQMKIKSSKTTDRLQRIKIETDFRNEHQYETGQKAF